MVLVVATASLLLKMAGQPTGARVRVTVITEGDCCCCCSTTALLTAASIICWQRAVGMLEAVVKMVAVAGIGVIVVICGHTVMETVVLTQVVHGGHFTNEHGIVNGNTTITVDPPGVSLLHGTVTEEHPNMHV